MLTKSVELLQSASNKEANVPPLTLQLNHVDISTTIIII
jgi:hypothetical protein